jgi:hypothetical protein
MYLAALTGLIIGGGYGYVSQRGGLLHEFGVAIASLELV